jgi:serine/threonine-protein kinase RsbW
MEVLAKNGRKRRTRDREGLVLDLPAKPESLRVARQAVAALGARLGLPEARIDDLRTLVTEACANAVTHAYDGGEGSIRLRVIPRGDELTIVVADDGVGIKPRPASEKSSGRLGLLLMAALSSKVEIAQRPGGGTRVKVRFPLSNGTPLA